VKLKAVAAPGSIFVGWSNSFCKGTLGPCAFTIASYTTITATFVSAPPTGGSKIIYVGVCGAGCFDDYGWYDPRERYSYIDPLNDTLLNAFGQGKFDAADSGLDAIGLRIGKLFPTSVTLVAGFSLEVGVIAKGAVDAVVALAVGQYKPGDQIYLVGHSSGGAIVQKVTKKLSEKRIPVAGMGLIDAVSTDTTVPTNVARAFNFYYPKSFSCPIWGITRIVSAQNSGTIVSNVRIDAPVGPDSSLCGGHMNMDNDPLVWRPILDFMVGIR
jgi:hypothetical protein